MYGLNGLCKWYHRCSQDKSTSETAGGGRSGHDGLGHRHGHPGDVGHGHPGDLAPQSTPCWQQLLPPGSRYRKGAPSARPGGAVVWPRQPLPTCLLSRPLLSPALPRPQPLILVAHVPSWCNVKW